MRLIINPLPDNHIHHVIRLDKIPKAFNCSIPRNSSTENSSQNSYRHLRSRDCETSRVDVHLLSQCLASQWRHLNCTMSFYRVHVFSHFIFCSAPWDLSLSCIWSIVSYNKKIWYIQWLSKRKAVNLSQLIHCIAWWTLPWCILSEAMVYIVFIELSSIGFKQSSSFRIHRPSKH